MILLIDNYDSFSYNLYQLIGSVNPDIKVIRNDELTVDEIKALKPTHINCHRDLSDPTMQAFVSKLPQRWVITKKS